MANQTKPYYLYWAKTSKNTTEGKTAYHLLPYHLLDVAAVGYELLKQDTRLRKRLADLCGMPEDVLHLWLTFMLALHDVGKFSETFQHLKIDVWEKLGNAKPPQKYDYKHRHDWLGMLAWNYVLRDELHNTLPSYLSFKDTASEQAVSWAQPIFGHHGKPLDNTGEMDKIWNSTSQNIYFNEKSCIAAQAFMHEAWRLVLSKFPHVQTLNIPEKISPIASWVIAGFAVLADWIGSNQNDFFFQQDHRNLDEYWNGAIEKAKKAIANKKITTKNVAEQITFKDLFPFIDAPTALQKWAGADKEQCVPIRSKPQLFIIEDMTGAGKTEAALMLAYRIMAHEHGRQADGVFIALPTMATSNAMYERLAVPDKDNGEKEPLYRRFFAEKNDLNSSYKCERWNDEKSG